MQIISKFATVFRYTVLNNRKNYKSDMSQKKDAEDCQSEEASSQAESFDANKSGTSETYDMKDFCPGIRIEAKDFDGKWYPAKVSDVDWTENEILVHFENWNTKFDEWIPMDSSRLRSLQKPSVPHKKEHAKYSKGEEVMAMWSPYQKYPATIQAVLPNDRYDVLFYDGFLKRLKSHKISKLENETIKTEVQNFTDIGTKEERRERKRKINVAELFHVNKRSKKKGLVHSKSHDIKTYPVSKSKSKNTALRKPGNLLSLEKSENGHGAESKEVRQRDDKLPNSGTTVSSKALVDTIPAAFEVKYINGQTEMWSKQLYQRSEGRTAGKLDIVILNPQGRKFRSRNEIMKYCEENGIIYSHEAFDFSAKGRPKSKSNTQTLSNRLEQNSEERDKLSLKKGQKKPQSDISLSASQNNFSNAPVEVLPASGVAADENKVFIGDFEVVIENGKFICPVKTCAKHFRRENLLHMHMKHYHPEFSKYLDYTPSVTDLAYARTVGGHDSTEVSSPALRKSEKSEKFYSKVENLKKASDTPLEYGKEGKKIKLSETRTDSKLYSNKGFNESCMPPTDSPDLSVDGSQKTSHLLAKNSSNLNELSFKNESSNFERNDGTSIDIKAELSILNSKRNSIASQSVMKSLRHKLNNRKKANRFQGSFAEHMRKKRLISQDHSKSQSKTSRQQQSQHLRQQLHQSPSLAPSSMPGQSIVVDDVNANATSPSHTIPRYPKPPLSIMNEMSGKNNLLTSSLSPATVDIMNQKGYESKVKLNGSNEKSEKSKMESNRRNFLTGLINARKRRATMTYRVRKKRKRAVKEGRIRLSGFSEEPNAGQSQVVLEKTNLMAPNNDGVATSQSTTKNEGISKDMMFKKSLRLKLKRIDASTSKWVQNDSPNRHNTEFLCLSKYNVETDSAQTSGNGIDKTENASVPKDLEGKPESDEKIPSEFSESPFSKKTNTKGSVDSNSLPKSYVLLENVCRKEVYGKYLNVSRRGNDENVGERQNDGAKPKINRRGKRDGRRVPGKRVRFEKTVQEKWIPMEEGTQERVIESEGGEGRRDERKRKSAKGQSLDDHLMRERETIVQLHESDDVARDDTIPQINSGLESVEGADDSKSGLAVENSKVEKLRRNEIINCVCGITEEDGLMIQCDLCLCWQHGHCTGIFRESDVPDKYTCAICKNPYRARSSMKYLHDQEWLKEGTLPSLSFRSKREEVINQRKTILKRSHDLSGSIALLARVIHSLRLKVNIAEKKDHPKLWLWAKKWTEKKPNRLKDDSEVKEEKPDINLDVSNEVKKEGDLGEDDKQLPKAPEPEAPIDSAECKLNLLDHLIHYQTLVDARLSCIESLVAELESMQDDAVNDEAPDRCPRTKATVQMLLRDLNTMKKFAII